MAKPMDVLGLAHKVFGLTVEKSKFGYQLSIAKQLLSKYSMDEITYLADKVKGQGVNIYSLAYLKTVADDYIKPYRQEQASKRVAEMKMPEPKQTQTTNNKTKANKFGNDKKWDGWG